MLINAKFVSTTEHDGVAILAFADDETSPSKFIVLQRTLRPDRQDRELGQDRVHIQVNSESKSGYADISQAVLDEHRLSLRIAKDTANSIGVDDDIEIRFIIPRDELLRVESWMRKLVDAGRLQTRI